MPRQKKTSSAPNIDIKGLPELTEKQFKFVKHVLEGKSLSDSYREAYDCSDMQPTSIWVNASKLRHDAKVALWVSAARRAGVEDGILTAQKHLSRLGELSEEARMTGNYGAAVQAEIHRGKVSKLYTDTIELEVANRLSDDEMLNRIRSQLGEQAAIEAHKKLKGER